MSVATQTDKTEAFQPQAPDVSHLITEDDTPVDNIGSEKNQRLLTSVLYDGWTAPGGVSFLACANVGMYESPQATAIVPDVFLSLDVKAADDHWEKQHRCYLFWIFGKAPEIAIEIVSDRDGLELSGKIRRYARMGISYYVVFDPAHHLSDHTLQCFELRARHYQLLDSQYFPDIQLGVTLWDGEFEGSQSTWLRWCDQHENIIPTGKERIEIETRRAETEAKRAEIEAKRAEKLAERLRSLGIDPEKE